MIATKTQKIPISLTATRIEGGCRTELRGSPRFFLKKRPAKQETKRGLCKYYIEYL